MEIILMENLKKHISREIQNTAAKTVAKVS